MRIIDSTTVSADSATLADRAADKVKSAVDATRDAANKSLSAAEEGIESVREGVADTLCRTAAGVGKYVRAGQDYASGACGAFKDRVSGASECSAAYVREKPVQAIALAVLGGVLLASLIGLLGRSRERDF